MNEGGEGWEKEREEELLLFIFQIFLDFPCSVQSCRTMSRVDQPIKNRDVIGLAFLVFLLGVCVGGLLYRQSRDESLLAVYEEGEAWMTVIKTIQRYESKTLHRLPDSLRQDPILTEKILLKPLEARLKQRMALLERVTKELKEQQ